MLFSGLLLVGTVICLVIATPVLVIFSPVIVPAAITVLMIIAGFMSSGGFGVTAVTLLKWMYDYVTGKHHPDPVGARQLDQQLDQARLALKESGQQQERQAQTQQTCSTAYHVVKAATAVTAGGSSLLFSGLVLVGTVICLIIATPVLVIFSPVIVPAAIAVVIIITGFVTSGGFGVTGVTLFKWMYDYVAGKHPIGADQLDQASRLLTSKVRDIKQFGQQ